MSINQKNNSTYCPNLFGYERFVTRVVPVGDVPMGGSNPIRIQSMTTTDTMDTQGTVEQSIRMIEAGCEYVRITAPSITEAENLAKIKAELRSRGYNAPLVADIHFTPNAAEVAARIVEKVRINPGNYADKKKFQVIDYSDHEYEAELDRIRKKFSPLVAICKQEGTAMRIGTNHGSLSDRIMSRYGDTPMGMVESAMEFIRICEDLHYHDLVISMKASNPQIMVQAYRLLVNQMMENGQNYPLHLGVTEAGDGEDGRIKSAVGIGALLEDGLGDTVRVSLTEEPEAEIPVARKLIERYSNRQGHLSISQMSSIPISPFHYQKTDSKAIQNIGGDQVPIVIADLRNRNINQMETFEQIGYQYSPSLDKYNLSDLAADFALFGSRLPDTMPIPGGLKPIVDYSFWQELNLDGQTNCFPILTMADLKKCESLSSKLNFISILAEDLAQELEFLKNVEIPIALVFETENAHAMPQLRQALFDLSCQGIQHPVILKRNYESADQEQVTLDASADVGPLFLDGFGQGICISDDHIDLKTLNSISFGILQATRTRITKTEYISCPSCGRTLFDLQETTAMIRAKTNHLKGVKIGIMGCIVNGPGEMADADYGYVGSGVGKITLYRGQEVVKRQIDAEFALEELIEIIKEDGRWIEDPVLQD